MVVAKNRIVEVVRDSETVQRVLGNKLEGN